MGWSGLIDISISMHGGKAMVNLITHAHGDHARSGSAEYWCAEDCAQILRHRLGPESVRPVAMEWSVVARADAGRVEGCLGRALNTRPTRYPFEQSRAVQRMPTWEQLSVDLSDKADPA